MPKITVRNIVDLGITALLFQREPDSEVKINNVNYYCILPHTATDDNKPGSGANWQTHWVVYGVDGKEWTEGDFHGTPFTDYVNPIISDKSGTLIDRVGQAAYDKASVLKDVTRTELCMVAAELVQRRINIVLSMVQPGMTVNTTSEEKQKTAYLNEVDSILIPKILAGTPAAEDSGFASGVIITHRSRSYEHNWRGNA